ncbi:hypothetical protein BSL78_06604 [Apostichopus japonicus]|uniref:RPA-interacting protein C-terminal domain-containing protein n=1 Tax=Stichopus japonicus TaxID=307972 RepID=A0A2G8L8A0_STIJA|nr:hypothetical protein BSL78_06604 [Apostichopus japonicus]
MWRKTTVMNHCIVQHRYSQENDFFSSLVIAERCLDRLRNSREQLIQRFRGNLQDGEEGSPQTSRSIIQKVLREEWKQMERDKELMSFGSDEFEEFEEIISLMEDMQAELMVEESALIAEAEHHLKMEQEQVNKSAETLSASDDVICPVCRGNHLMLNKGIFFCSCGLRVDTKQDGLTLQNVKKLLEDAVNEHGGHCNHVPQFCPIDMGGGVNLVMGCEKCDVMHIII